MLGVRRVGVTRSAQELQKHGLIHYSRGDITILDRTGLEGAACQCYEVVKDMHDGTKSATASRPAPADGKTGLRQHAAALK
jgi:hypothetical protein